MHAAMRGMGDQSSVVGSMYRKTKLLVSHNTGSQLLEKQDSQYNSDAALGAEGLSGLRLHEVRCPGPLLQRLLDGLKYVSAFKYVGTSGSAQGGGCAQGSRTHSHDGRMAVFPAGGGTHLGAQSRAQFEASVPRGPRRLCACALHLSSEMLGLPSCES
jgi:hypothetical protein